MAVFSEPEQYQVELTNAAQRVSVGEGGGARTELGGNWVHTLLRDRDMIEPFGSRHLAVAFRVVDRQAALVSEVHVPVRPVGVLVAEQSIDAARCVATGEHDQKLAALCDRAPGGVDDSATRGLLHLRKACEANPAYFATSVGRAVRRAHCFLISCPPN